MSGDKVNFQLFSGLGLHNLILKPPRKKYTSSFNILRPTFIVARFGRVCLTSLLAYHSVPTLSSSSLLDLISVLPDSLARSTRATPGSHSSHLPCQICRFSDSHSNEYVNCWVGRRSFGYMIKTT